MATWLTPVENVAARVAAASTPGEKVLGTLPFLGEGGFPLDETVGAGLGQRRALDLSILTSDTLVIPPEKFFIRTGRPDRQPPTPSWKVRVHGLVETPGEIPIEELRRDAAPMGTHLLECAGNSRRAHFGLMSAARWSGVKLERVLERFRPQPRATQVLVSGLDEHSTLDPGSTPGASWVLGLAQIREAGAFLATEMNGAPLGPDHGYPLRLVVPGWYACAAIKWVNEIALLDDEAVATDHMREYAGRTHQTPAGPRDRRLMAGGTPAGGTAPGPGLPAGHDRSRGGARAGGEAEGPDGTISYRIVGLLWGGLLPTGVPPVRPLHIRLNPALSFVPVEAIESSGGLPWTLWSHTIPPPLAGRYRIELAVKDPGVRTRRLDIGYYAREIEITGD